MKMGAFELDMSLVLSRTAYFHVSLESLLTLLQPSYFCLDLVVKILLHGPDGSGKRLLSKMAAKELNMSFCGERVADLIGDTIEETGEKLKIFLSAAAASAPCLIYLSGYELFCDFDQSDMDQLEQYLVSIIDELMMRMSSNKQPMVLIVGTDNYEAVFQSPLSSIVQHCVAIKSPTLEQAHEIMNAIETELELDSKLVSSLKKFQNGEYYLGNLINLAVRAQINNFYTIQHGSTIRSQGNDSVQRETRWSDIGGLESVKREIIDVIEMSIKYPQIQKTGLRRTGILLYGPPGTGKTLLARAVASECGMSFINVKGPELLNEYVGQSEDNVRRLFKKAHDSSPSIIFFDELDSLAPNRGQAGDSGGVMDRIVSQILAEMDGISRKSCVFVIGATNRVDLVDPSLQRPGRFDKVLEVPLSTSKESRIKILKALTGKMKLSDDVSIEKIESIAQPNLSGADFQGLCSRALHRTFERCVLQVESGQSNEDEIEIITTMDDFAQSLEE